MAEHKNTSTPLLPDWSYVQAPHASALLKASPEDFVVEEQLGFELCGEGEHLWLFIEKKSLNTLAVVKTLAERFNIPENKVGYAGLKDKQAVTRQWFSISTPLDVENLTILGVNVLKVKRHRSKIKRGAHRSNRFEIMLRNLCQSREIANALSRIGDQGVPNYFGAQRFGSGGKNLDKARMMFNGKLKPPRFERGIYLSAARAFLFNEVLSVRVKDGNWNTGLAGEAMMLSGSNSFFKAAVIDDELNARLARFDIHPSGPLWGKGNLPSSMDAYELETDIALAQPALAQGLADFGLRQQRRALRLCVDNFKHQWVNDQTLKLKFELIKGSFATTVLRELITIEA